MSLATIGNLFGPDTAIILLVVLVFFGAKRLPELARGLGQSILGLLKFADGLTEPASEFR